MSFWYSKPFQIHTSTMRPHLESWGGAGNLAVRTQLCLLWKTQCPGVTWSKELSSIGYNKIPYSSRGNGTLVRMLLAGVCGHFLLVGRPSKQEEYISKYVWGFFCFVFSMCVCLLLLLLFFFSSKKISNVTLKGMILLISWQWDWKWNGEAVLVPREKISVLQSH